jgi:hypothetical protein
MAGGADFFSVCWDSGKGQEERVISKSLRERRVSITDNLAGWENMWLPLERVEDGDTILYGITQKFRSRKRLYELSFQLGKQFMQISKSTLVNLSYLDSIQPGFGGTMLLKLKNGCKDYVSRKYLPAFKNYLGL